MLRAFCFSYLLEKLAVGFIGINFIPAFGGSGSPGHVLGECNIKSSGFS